MLVPVVMSQIYRAGHLALFLFCSWVAIITILETRKVASNCIELGTDMHLDSMMKLRQLELKQLALQ